MVVTPADGTLRIPLAQAPFNDRFARVFGSALTPQAVTTALSAADQGFLYPLADLLDEVRERDTHLHAVLAKRELQVAGAEWELRPPPKSGKRGEEIARWCSQRLLEIEALSDLDRSFPDALSDLQGALYHGRAGHEVVWRVDGRWQIPGRLSWIHSRRFAYALDWSLHLYDQSGTSPDAFNQNNGPFGVFPGVALSRFPAGKFVVHRPRVRGVYPTREGLGRTVVWYAMFKRFTIRDWLAFAEWAGRGLRVGKFAAGADPKMPMRATPEDQAVLEAALDAFSSTVSVVIPDTTDLTIQNAPKNNDVHEKLVTLCNAEMSKCVLGETMSTDVGPGGGNRALGEVHRDVSLMVARADARSLAATLRRDLLRPMAWMNFGENAPVPEIAFSTDPSEDRDALAARIRGLVKDTGLKVSQNDVRNMLGIPDPEEGDELLGLMPTAPALPTPTPPIEPAPSE